MEKLFSGMRTAAPGRQRQFGASRRNDALDPIRGIGERLLAEPPIRAAGLLEKMRWEAVWLVSTRNCRVSPNIQISHGSCRAPRDHNQKPEQNSVTATDLLACQTCVGKPPDGTDHAQRERREYPDKNIK